MKSIYAGTPSNQKISKAKSCPSHVGGAISFHDHSAVLCESSDTWLVHHVWYGIVGFNIELNTL